MRVLEHQSGLGQMLRDLLRALFHDLAPAEVIFKYDHLGKGAHVHGVIQDGEHFVFGHEAVFQKAQAGFERLPKPFAL